MIHLLLKVASLGMQRNKKKIIVSSRPKDLASDLGLTYSDAVEWEIRHSVVKKIITIVKKRRISVTKLAKLSKTSRARITKILNADSCGISLDVLFRVLGATGQKVRLIYRDVA